MVNGQLSIVNERTQWARSGLRSLVSGLRSPVSSLQSPTLFRAERGANVIEMIFLTVFLLLLFAGTIDFGRAFNSYIVITNAAREGARIGGRLPCTTTNRVALRNAIIEAAVREAEESGTTLLASGITIIPDPVVDGCAAAGTPIEVRVAFDYTPLMGEITGIGGFRMGNGATSVAFGNDQEP